MPPDAALEFSRPVPLGTVPHTGRRIALSATPGECAALAARFGILGLDSLAAEFQLMPEEEGTVRVQGRARRGDGDRLHVRDGSRLRRACDRAGCRRTGVASLSEVR